MSNINSILKIETREDSHLHFINLNDTDEIKLTFYLDSIMNNPFVPLGFAVCLAT